MNKLSVYTDIDTLFDTRRGILEHMLRKGGHTWDNYKDVYKARRLDFFEAPELGITQEGYLKRFGLRDVDDWIDATCCYFYPSKIAKEILPIVRAIEFGSTRTIMVAKIELYINMYPFDMSESLQENLINHLLVSFKIPIDIKMVNVSYDNQHADFIGSYNYVFRYGHLVNPDFKRWFETFPSSTRSGTKIIVPDLLARPIGDVDELEPLRNESAKTLIEKMSSVQGGKCIFIPLDKDIFDYVDV